LNFIRVYKWKKKLIFDVWHKKKSDKAKSHLKNNFLFVLSKKLFNILDVKPGYYLAQFVITYCRSPQKFNLRDPSYSLCDQLVSVIFLMPAGCFDFFFEIRDCNHCNRTRFMSIVICITLLLNALNLNVVYIWMCLLAKNQFTR
jgi:hypothetical protein